MQTLLIRLLIKILPARMLERLRAIRLDRSLRTFPQRVVEHRYGDATLKVLIADSIAEGWYDRDWDQLPEIERLRDSLTAGALVFNIGAHQGVIASMIAREIGSGGKVVAVEASKHNCSIALQNVELNRIENLEVICAAVCERNGTVNFNQQLNGRIELESRSSERQKVVAITLDELALRYGMPSLVYIDVEGAECLVLRGAQTLRQQRIHYFVEVHVGCGLELLGGSAGELLSFFPESQFTRLVKSEADVEFHELRSGDSILNDRFFLLARPIC